MIIVRVEQHLRGHLVRLQQMMDVRATVMPAREALAPGHDRARIRAVRERPEVHLVRVSARRQPRLLVLLLLLLLAILLRRPVAVAPFPLGARTFGKRSLWETKRVSIQRAPMAETRVDEVHARLDARERLERRAEPGHVPRFPLG